jgi:hypothetical protein
MSSEAYYGVVWVTGVFATIGLLVVVVAASIALRYRRREREGLVTEARVVAVHPMQDSEGDTLYKSEFEFHDRRGAHHRVVSKLSCAPARHQVGERVRVSYEADKPEEADVLLDSRWLVIAAVAGLGLITVTSLFFWAVATGRIVDGD